MFHLLHKTLEEIEMSEIEHMYQTIHGMEADLEHLRIIMSMRMDGEYTSKFDNNVKGSIYSFLARLHELGKEANEVLMSELKKRNQ